MTITKLPAPALPDWLAAEVPFVRYRLRVNGYRMHVMECGQGRPVLLLHGNPTWGFLYRKVAAALTGEPLRLIMPDLIGLGFSDKPRRASAHQLEAHGHWMSRLVEILDLHDYLLVVQDWGGAIGILAATDRPGALGGLVILNTIVGPPKPGFRPTAFHRFAQTPIVSDLVFRAGLVERLLFLAQGDKRSIRGVTARAYRYPLRDVRDNVAPLALARMVPNSFEHPTIAPLRRCQAFVDAWDGPTAIVWGDRDPVLGRVRTHMERTFPQASLRRTTAGHFLQEEVPDEIAAAIREVHAAGR